jgi:type IV secretion system protein VirB6
MVIAQGPFYSFDQTIQAPFTNGVESTVNATMSAVQGPLTALVVLWIIVTGILVMRGDVSVQSGITRIITISLVVGILMSTTLYDVYIVTFFTTGLPSYFSSSIFGQSRTIPTPQTFDNLWFATLNVFNTAETGLSWTQIVYEIEFVILEAAILVPIIVVFLIYEVTQMVTDIVVCIGPFCLAGYLFQATKGIADRFVSKLIGLALLSILVDIVLSIIISGFLSYVNTTQGYIVGSTKAESVGLCLQLVIFFAIGSLLTTFLPGIASYIGGGISISPLAMANTAQQARGVLPKGRRE